MEFKKKLLRSFLIIGLLISCKTDEANYYHQKAYQAEENEDFTQAIIYLDKAIKLNPQFAQAYLDRAIDKSIFGLYKEAIQDLDKVIDLKPKWIEAFVCRAEYKRFIDDYEGAYKDTKKALRMKEEIDKENKKLININMDIPIEDILYERAASGYHLGYYNNAIKDLNYCIQQNFLLSDSWCIKGLCLIKIDSIEEGCKSLKKAASFGSEIAEKSIEEYCKS